MNILADSSVWIDFFRRKNEENRLPFYLSNDLIVINDLILSEIVPALKIKKQNDTIKFLQIILKSPLSINWDEIIELQFSFIKKHNHFIGIPDLIIFQNARQNGLRLYSYDKDIIQLCEFYHYSCLM